jgi:hypothetical protein
METVLLECYDYIAIPFRQVVGQYNKNMPAAAYLAESTITSCSWSIGKN